MGEAPVGEMVERIVAGFDPLSVVLFGSLARGEGAHDSDADLLVVVSEIAREDKRRLTVEIRRALANVPFPKDIVVTDLEEIERRGDLVGDVLRPALREGKVLYERPGLNPFSGRRVPGSFGGKLAMREDFDDPLPEGVFEDWFRSGEGEQG